MSLCRQTGPRWSCLTTSTPGDPGSTERHSEAAPPCTHFPLPPTQQSLSPERFGRQDTEARLLQHLPDLVSTPGHGVGLHLPGALVVRGELHVSRQVGDGEAVALLLLYLGNVRAAVLLLVHHPAEELFED